ncbi:HAD-IA family hydrolase [Candidatus Woesearchaeota archaeon]|nr:HAD-IA family hydrolase [Candidatus Woesearchaeota archaeon]
MKNGFKAAIFDLDGTLVTTDLSHAHGIIRRTLHELGIHHFPEEAVKEFWYRADRGTVIRDYFNAPVDAFWNLFHLYDLPKSRAAATHSYPDVAILYAYKKQGYKLGVFTSSQPAVAALELALVHVPFDVVVCAHPSLGIPYKPHPGGIYHCLEKLQVQSHQAIFVGNGQEDIEAAQRAQVHDVYLDRGEYIFPQLHPTSTITSLHGLDHFL